MRKWTVRDRYGNDIYITEERWKHITGRHEELIEHFDDVLDTLRKGRRKQEALDPSKYRYYRACDTLPPRFNHIIVAVVFKIQEQPNGSFVANNFVTSAWPVYIHGKR